MHSSVQQEMNSFNCLQTIVTEANRFVSSAVMKPAVLRFTWNMACTMLYNVLYYISGEK